MLLTNKYQRITPVVAGGLLQKFRPAPKPCSSSDSSLPVGWVTAPLEHPLPGRTLQANRPNPSEEVDSLYLFACHLAWQQHEDPSAAWELLAGAQSSNGNTRAQALAFLANSHHLGGIGTSSVSDCSPKQKRVCTTETNMKAPYGLDIVNNCCNCLSIHPGFFCGFSPDVQQLLNQAGHKSVLPSGAILFVEGQSPRGIFIVCSGKVNLSTTSREGKILLLKTAAAGEALGLSATISGTGYESTAETAVPCQVNFLEREHLLGLMQEHSEVGVHAAQCLSRDFQSAYRDIHDLVLTRSSAGKLARLLLLHSPTQGTESAETRLHAPMTHEEMAQRIGSSRETVTRLLSGLKKKQLIRLDGPTLIIRDRTALEAMAF